MNSQSSSISICQPSCGYYFSSGCYVSGTVYSGNTVSPHSPLYNAASRVVIDGGRKAVAYMAMAGMFAQNLEIAAYAETTAPSEGIYHALMSYPYGTEISGMNPDGTSWTISGNVASDFILKNQWLNVKSGGSAVSTVVSRGGTINAYSGGYAGITTVYSGGALNVLAGGSVTGITQSSGGNVKAIVKYMPGMAGTYISGTNQENGIFELNYYTNGTAAASNFIINSGGWQHVSSGGQSISATVNNGGALNVYADGTADTAVVNGGTLTVYSGGKAEYASASNGGTINISWGGTANYAVINATGTMNVYGSALSATASSGGVINISRGGTANYAKISSGGTLNLISGGSSYSPVVYSGGKLTISGGYASGIVQSAGGIINADISGNDTNYAKGYYAYNFGSSGMNNIISPSFYISSGIASGTYINSGGIQNVYSGGSSLSAIVNKGGVLNVYSGGITENASMGILSFYGGSWGWSPHILSSGGTNNIYTGGIAYSTVIYAGGVQNISGGTAESTLISSGFQNIYSGGIANKTSVLYNTIQTIYSGGIANGTFLDGYGSAIIKSGGKAYGINQQYSIISFEAYGNDSETHIDGTNPNGSFLLENGIASNFLIYGGATQKIYSGAIAIDNVLSNGGKQYIYSGGVASHTLINPDNGGGSMFVYSGAAAISTVMHNGNLFLSGGSSYNAIVSDGSLFIAPDGLAMETEICGGRLTFSKGGVAISTVLRSGSIECYGGKCNISSTDIYGGNIYDNGGQLNASDITLHSGGGITLKGTITNLIQSSGGIISLVAGKSDGNYVQGINAEGNPMLKQNHSASGFIIYSGGLIKLEAGGSAFDTILNGGKFVIRGNGYAFNTVVNSGGEQSVENTYTNYNVYPPGGYAVSTIVNSGGLQNISRYGSANITYINSGGSQFIQYQASAVSAFINSGGIQNIDSNASAFYTVVSSGGKVLVSAGGSSINTVQQEGGNIIADVMPDKTNISTYITGTNQYGENFSLVNGTASNFVLNNGGWQNVNSGGLAISTTVNSGAYQLVKATAKASDTVINDGGALTVQSGGSAVNIIQNSGGIINAEIISGDSNTFLSGTYYDDNPESGRAFALQNGSASGLVINSGASQTVQSGAMAEAMLINSGGILTINSGGSSIRTEQAAGGIINAYAIGGDTYTVVQGTHESGSFSLESGTASGFILNSGANLYVSSGGSATGIKQSGGNVNAVVMSGDSSYVQGINDDGRTFLLQDGIASGFTVNSGGSLTVSAGGMASSTVIGSGGLENISSGGSSLYAVIGDGGKQNVYASGYAATTTVNNGGMQVISEGGKAVSTVLSSGGQQDVSFSGIASNTVVLDGGILVVNSLGSAYNAVVSSGGTVDLLGGGSIYWGRSSILVSTVVNSGGLLKITGSANASNTYLLGGTLQVNNTQARADITYVSSGGVFELNTGSVKSAYAYDGGHIVIKGGTAASSIHASSGGIIDMYAGSLGDNTIWDSGVQNIYGGTAIYTTVNSGGTQNLYASGTASSTTIFCGVQNLSGGGTTFRTSLNYGGIQNVNDGGIVSSTVLISSLQNVYSGGTAKNTILSSGGSQIISSGGYASGTNVVNVRGSQIISNGGIASGTILSYGAIFINDGAKVDGLILSAGVININVTANSETYVEGSSPFNGSTASNPWAFFSMVNGVAHNFRLNSSGAIMNIQSGGSAVNTLIQLSAVQNVHSTGTAISNNIQQGGTVNVSFGGNLISAITALSMGSTTGYSMVINVYSGGKAEYDKISLLGIENLSGGTANYTTVNSGGKQNVYASGVANYAVINATGTQNVYAGGIAVSATLNSSGVQSIYSSGIASGTTIRGGGSQYVVYGGTATATYISGGGRQYLGKTSGSAVMSKGGCASGTVIDYKGSQFIYESGIAAETTIGMGSQIVSSGGLAISTTINNGGYQCIYSGGAAVDTILNSTVLHYEQRIFSSGLASHTTVNSGGRQEINSNGSAISTVLNDGGILSIYRGAKAYNVSQLSGGIIYLDYATIEGGDTQTYINGTNESGTFLLENGSASNFVLNSGAYMQPRNGFIANSTTVNSGGCLNIQRGGKAYDIKQLPGAVVQAYVIGNDTATYANGTNESGTFLLENGVASNFVLNRADSHLAAYEAISAGGIASNTTVNSGALLEVLSGGSAVNTVINSGGIQSVRTYNNNGTYVAGGTVWHDTINPSGSAIIYGDNTLYGNTVLNNGGNIHISRLSSNATVPATLGVENLIADGGTFYMGVDLENKTGDQIQITSSHSGSAFISLTNTASTAVAISGTELKLVDYADGTEIAADASFALTNGTYEEGDYVYTLQQDSEDNNYYLRSTGKPTSGANNAGSIPNLNGAGVGVALNSLQKRLGDLRGLGSNAERHGIWARSYYKNMTVKAHEDVKMDVSGLEAGWDFKLSGYDYSGDNHQNTGLYLGLMAASINISADGKGSGEGILGGGYATYLAENGWFADFTLRGGNTEMDVITHTNIGTRIQISPKRDFIAASVETGYTADMRHDGKGWKIEPKAELQYMSMGSKDTETNTHIPVRYGGVNYYTGIGTVYASYTSIRKNSMMTEPFAEIAYKYEFDGEEKVKYNTAYMESDAGGGTIEARLGVNMQLTSSLYWHAAVNWEDGHSQKSYGADAGIRYMFGGK